MDVVQQNLASYRKDFKDGAKGHVLQQHVLKEYGVDETLVT